MPDLFDLPFEDDDEPTPEPEAGPPQRRILSVSQLTAAVRELLEGEFPQIWVEGEISNGRTWNTGHYYFTLKDNAAQIKAVMFRSAVRSLRFKPEDGLHVIARGRVSVYDPKGEYQLVCEHLEPHGLGALQLAFDQLKKRLQAEGLFDAARKRPLPALPAKIGIVTSLDGAAVHDIIKVLRRRYPNAHLVIRPTRVQGEGAAREIARGLNAIGRVPGVDVIIVGRGGGSIEDLWAFNEEVVARAIAAAPVPIVSAVGHESDVTIADFVADVRAPTPSAAAEIVVRAKDEFCGRIDRLHDRLRGAMRARLHRLGSRVHQLSGVAALAGWPVRLANQGRRVAELTHELRRHATTLVARRARRHDQLRALLDAFDVRRRFERTRRQLGAADAALRAAIERRRHRADVRLRSAAGRLDTLSPLAVLARGYAVCWDDTRTRVIRDAATVQPGDNVRVTLDRGELACRVERTDGESDVDKAADRQG
jgi:exodeoxyribonuclease VII large subunit